MYDDGGGILRIKYKDPISAKTILEEMDLVDDPVLTATNEIDSTQIKLKSKNNRFISNIPSNKLKNSVSINLRVTPKLIYLEPTILEVNNKKITGFSYSFKDKTNLNKKFLLSYFDEEEDLVKYFFQDKTRSLTAEEKSIKIHFIMVANTFDSKIKESVAGSLTNMRGLVKDIANYLNLKVDSTVIYGANYNKGNVEAALKKLKPAKNDIVLFYYTGHGYCNRVPNDKTLYPYMDLRSNPEVQDHTKETMNIEDVFNNIIGKQARLNLIISECCNENVEALPAVGTKPVKKKSSGMQLISEDNMRNLFLSKSRTSILFTSAKKLQRANGNPSIGGFYTYFFKSSMEYYCSLINKGTTWNTIIKNTKDLTEYKAQHTYCTKPFIPQNICVQNPVVKMIVDGKVSVY